MPRSLEIAYDGNPVFQPIEGTSLQNAVNAPVPVIRVNEESFYALDNGVWFVSSSPFGPWTVTSYVPAVIYSIPRSSPLYYVTYVRVYDATPEVVYVGYSPGYVGSYVSSDNVVVYGTGWPYRPWIGSVWYGAPVTWGFGFSFVYSWWNPYPWYGWNRVAWVPPPPCFRPWWGPWRAPVPVYGYRRPAIVAGGVNPIRPPVPRVQNVGRIYDRWDHKSVVWNGPRSIANQPRTAAPPHSRPTPGSGFVAGSDGRWRQLGDDGHRDRGGRDVSVRGNVANSPPVPPRAVQHRPPFRHHPPFRHRGVVRRLRISRARDPRRCAFSRHRSEATNAERRKRDRSRRANAWGISGRRIEVSPRARMDGRLTIDRSREIVQPGQPVPRGQFPQRIPPVAGVPIERAPSLPQRAMPSPRSFSPQANIIERPAVANPGRGMERPSANSGRMRGTKRSWATISR